jgi:RNase adaptor protein for sRNA GlmZ degradation
MLVAKVYSFSFVNHPLGSSFFESFAHGGGFVFDCRSLPNPGRHPTLACLTGLDDSVKESLRICSEVDFFLSSTWSLISHHLRRFTERGFQECSFGFGCTGGRHRSVYCAEFVSRAIEREFPTMVSVAITHGEKSTWSNQ